MPQKRLSMRKLKEVLRLHSLGLKQQQIARSCLIAQSTVHQYLKAAAAAGVKWPLPAGLGRPADSRKPYRGAPRCDADLAKERKAGFRRHSPAVAAVIATLHCNWSGKSIAKIIQTVTATADSASFTATG